MDSLVFSCREKGSDYRLCNRHRQRHGSRACHGRSRYHWRWHIGDLEDTRRTVENLGRECRCYHVDLSVSSDVDEVWIRLLEEAGHVDILCNNAGMQFRKNAFEYPEEMFDKVIAVNLKAPYRLSQKAAIHFREKGMKGKIINTASLFYHLRRC